MPMSKTAKNIAIISAISVGFPALAVGGSVGLIKIMLYAGNKDDQRAFSNYPLYSGQTPTAAEFKAVACKKRFLGHSAIITAQGQEYVIDCRP